MKRIYIYIPKESNLRFWRIYDISCYEDCMKKVELYPNMSTLKRTCAESIGIGGDSFRHGTACTKSHPLIISGAD